jgi:hypothetical protein
MTKYKLSSQNHNFLQKIRFLPIQLCFGTINILEGTVLFKKERFLFYLKYSLKLSSDHGLRFNIYNFIQRIFLCIFLNEGRILFFNCLLHVLKRIWSIG